MGVATRPSNWTKHHDTTNVNGTTTLVGAPGVGRRLVVLCVFVQEQSGVGGLIKLKEGDTTKYSVKVAGNASISLGTEGRNEWRLPTNQPLVFEQSATNLYSFTVDYTSEIGD
jgi:hypothetical protein